MLALLGQLAPKHKDVPLAFGVLRACGVKGTLCSNDLLNTQAIVRRRYVLLAVGLARHAANITTADDLCKDLRKRSKQLLSSVPKPLVKRAFSIGLKCRWQEALEFAQTGDGSKLRLVGECTYASIYCGADACTTDHYSKVYHAAMAIRCE